ncbi:IS3 family transposase [Streptomyces parvulus]|uniref:IS3 family transposase n=1 Tax=Streptomyces parvulus TaxID=146923 RepID=UPI0037030D40
MRPQGPEHRVRSGGRTGEGRGDNAAAPTGPRAGDGARHPAQGREVFRDGGKLVSRFQFVQDHRDAFGVKRLCRVLECSRSGFYRWLADVDARAARQQADAELAERIKKIHADSGGTYCSPRVTAELRGAGLKVNRKRVTRVMWSFSIVGVHLLKTVRTTIPEPSAAPVPDLHQRDFTATAPNTRYVGDITYLPIGDGQFLRSPSNSASSWPTPIPACSPTDRRTTSSSAAPGTSVH